MVLEIQQIEVDEWAIFCGDWQVSGVFDTREAAQAHLTRVIWEMNNG